MSSPEPTPPVPSPPEPPSTAARLAARRDVARARERRRHRRLRRLGLGLAVAAGWLGWRLLTGRRVGVPALPEVDPLYLFSGAFFLILIAVLIGSTLAAGRSPHITFRPEQIDARMTDVKGLGPVRDEVERTLDLFLSGRTFRREFGGSPRRGVLFEGAPGTGKTLMAKAMAAEAGVPFLFVSATSFQSMYYGATARRIRSYFAALRAAARAEGGAIGFIEEIDAIAVSRGDVTQAAIATATDPTSIGAAACCGGLTGLPFAPALPATVPPVGALTVHRNAAVSGDVGGVVNELLVQLQSFEVPTGAQRLQTWLVDRVNLLLPARRQLPRPRPAAADVLVIAATNRGDALDPALLRPGRFDRRLLFDVPDKAGRRELVDHFLARKAHEPVLDDEEHRDALAGVTQGYSPAMIERLMDEALVNALRRGGAGMSWSDVERARLVTEVGLGRPVGYTDHERRLIATHEAGHAVTAWLVAPHRRLEILTIVKRGGALGLLAHGDRDDVYTRSRRELEGLIRIAFGGQVAEEIYFGDVSTGPGSDLAYATRIGAAMVGQAGMAGTLVSFDADPGGVLSGGVVSRVLADRSSRQLLEDLLQRQKDEVRSLLGAHRHLVTALRDALLERHELVGHEITDVLRAAAGITPPGGPATGT